MANSLTLDPETLETVCDICGGTGGDSPKVGEDRWRCHTCNGAGYIPTALGKRVLVLIQHNFASMLRDVDDE